MQAVARRCPETKNAAGSRGAGLAAAGGRGNSSTMVILPHYRFPVKKIPDSVSVRNLSSIDLDIEAEVLLADWDHEGEHGCNFQEPLLRAYRNIVQPIHDPQIRRALLYRPTGDQLQTQPNPLLAESDSLQTVLTIIALRLLYAAATTVWG